MISMGKGNAFHKLFQIDEFARRFYCEHARLNQLRGDKLRSKRKVRRQMKEETKRSADGYDDRD